MAQYRHGALWRPHVTGSGSLGDPISCRPTYWWQTTADLSISAQLQACSHAWLIQTWTGAVSSFSVPNTQRASFQSAVTQAVLTFQAGGDQELAYIRVPAPGSAETFDDETLDSGLYATLINDSLGVLCNSIGDTASSYDSGHVQRGGIAWSLTIQNNRLRRRSSLWVGPDGSSVLNHFLHVDDIASGQLLLDMDARSNAGWAYTWSGPVLVAPAPTHTAGGNQSPDDLAVLQFASANGITKFMIPAPLESLFLTDTSTVDQSAAAACIAAILAQGLDNNGNALVSYIGGYRRKLRSRQP